MAFENWRKNSEQSVCISRLLNDNSPGIVWKMSQQSRDNSLELEVENFGPIVQAKIDLRPLTVFVGPSNTGKSYLAILVYALHRFFSGYSFPELERFPRAFHRMRQLGDHDLSDEKYNALSDWMKTLIGNPESVDQDSIILPPLVADALCSEFNALTDALSSEIIRCFGIGEVPALTRRSQAKQARVVIRRHIGNQSNPVEHEVSLSQNSEFRVEVPTEIPLPIEPGGSISYQLKAAGYQYLGLREIDSRDRKLMAREILLMLGDLVLPSLITPLHLPAYYLPADRTGVMHAHSVMVSNLIANTPFAGLRQHTRTPMLTGVLADFLEQLIEIAQLYKRKKGEKWDLDTNIENTILGGSVRINQSPPINYPQFAYRPSGWKSDLALANASSMVSELAPVVLYLRHLIKPGNVLIVEEPESHLHPAMQVEFTRQLALLVKAGVRVIVTTHSEWLLEELANIVRRSQISKVEHNGDESNGVALSPEEVGAWLFKLKKKPRGSIVEESQLDGGLYATGFDGVARELHNEWADVSSRIETD